MKRPDHQIAKWLRASWRVLLSGAMTVALLIFYSPAHADDIVPSRSLNIGTVTMNLDRASDSLIAETIVPVLNTMFRGPATEQQLTHALNGVVMLLESEGYRRARVSPSNFTVTGSHLNFELSIDPGPLFVVHSVVFSGAANTDTSWLRSMVDPQCDVPLTRVWIEQVLDRLNRVSNLSAAEQPQVEPLAEHPEHGMVDVRVRFAITENAPSRFDGLVAANGQGDQTALTGRAALEFGGLFGRDRTLSVHFDRPRPEWRAFNVRYHENGAFHAPLSWSVELDELTRNHRRQSISGETRYTLPGRRDWSLGIGALWRRVTPNGSSVVPARVSEVSLILSRSPSRFMHQRRARLSASLTAAYSHRRSLGDGTGDVAESRLRLTQQASLHLKIGAAWTLLLSSAGQWWPVGGDATGPGDEWYLGGAEMLRGYEQRWFAAIDGVWGGLELERRIGDLTRLSAFAEAADLQLASPGGVVMWNDTPYSYGWAISLHSLQRVGRLEFAWGRGAALRDGIVRLRITQSW
ncbi:MAG: hypothetical protein Kow0074_08030 [Candidatus Zixiibacteriota bacterium]